MNRTFRVGFPYEAMNDIMKIIKDEQPEVRSQEFGNRCTVTLSIRAGRAEVLLGKLHKVGGATPEEE